MEEIAELSNTLVLRVRLTPVKQPGSRQGMPMETVDTLRPGQSGKKLEQVKVTLPANA